jgi:FdrA protein
MMKKMLEDIGMTVSGNPEVRPNLLEEPVQVINIGLKRFADDLISQGVQVVEVDWVPPARGNPRLANLLSRLMD